jgi:hypothetical protein
MIFVGVLIGRSNVITVKGTNRAYDPVLYIRGMTQQVTHLDYDHYAARLSGGNQHC